MDFEEFRDYIRDNILIGWMPQAEVYIQEIKKNNGVSYYGLHIKEPGVTMTPSIYLEEYFLFFQNGQSLKKILEKIRSEYLWAVDKLSDIPENISLGDFSKVKDTIIYRLVNYERNKEMLYQCPHIRLYDLALTFRWLAHTDEIGISTVLISNREMENWKISVGELLLAARHNTEKMFPPSIITMDELLKNTGVEFGEKEKASLYVLTNEQQINGATTIIYEGILEKISTIIQDDFYLLPSSIHEMILVPGGFYQDEATLLKMVWEANRSVVAPGDILSDSVYYYNRRNKRVSLVASGE